MIESWLIDSLITAKPALIAWVLASGVALWKAGLKRSCKWIFIALGLIMLYSALQGSNTPKRDITPSKANQQYRYQMESEQKGEVEINDIERDTSLTGKERDERMDKLLNY